MAVKSLLVKCDYCYSESQVDFQQDGNEDDIFSTALLPDEDWFHLEGAGEEHDFCSRECLISHLA